MHLVNPNVSRLSPLFKAIIIRNLVKKIKPDVLHAHQIVPFGLYGALSGFHPFIISPWGSDLVTFPEKSKMHKFLVKYVLRKADLVQCVDEYLAIRVKSLIGERSNIRTIKWGINPDLFRPNEDEKDDITRVLYLRKSQEPYEVETLLYAIPAVIKVHENMEFLILKSGSDLNKTLDIVKKLRVGKHIKFIDEVPNDTMPTLMNSCNIYVDTIYREIPGSGIGMTALEAMSCGLPLVLSNTTGIELYVKNEVNGLIYKGGDSDSLSKAIIRLVENERLRNKLGRNARQYVLKNQDWDKNMKLMEHFYEKLTNVGAKA